MFSVLIPCYRPDPAQLRQALASVCSQAPGEVAHVAGRGERGEGVSGVRSAARRATKATKATEGAARLCRSPHYPFHRRGVDP